MSNTRAALVRAARDLLLPMVDEAISSIFDKGLHDVLMDQEEVEKTEYIKELKEYVNTLSD